MKVKIVFKKSNNNDNINKNTSIDERFNQFVSKVDEICTLDYYQLSNLSYETNYRYIYNVFSECRSQDRDQLCDKCLTYLKKRCKGINYNRMRRLYDILLYFSRIHSPAGMFLDEKLKDVKIQNRTLMELCLIQIDQNKELSEKLNSTLRDDIEDRVKKYYFD